MSISIIYYTDNSINEAFASWVFDHLEVAAEDKEIITISQKPISRGKNICIGEIGRSHLSLYKQLHLGGLAANTRFIALAEHDCLYTPEHFNWIPPRDDIFYYNVNHWFVQMNNHREGQFSYMRRRVLSMLVCNRELFCKAVEEKVWMLEHGYMIRKGKAGACEPGVIPPEEALIKAIPCEPGVCDHRNDYIAALNEFKDLGKEIGRWKAEAFRTMYPNIDIRHGGNFSGGRRARQTTYELPYWGTWKDILNGRFIGAYPC